jgi:type II secretory pathway pseudopilin PulG
MNKPFVARGAGRPTSFSIIELLAAITIIALLAALSLAALSGAYKSSLRSRTKSEIQGMTGALENYKADNGAYPSPPTVIFSSTNAYMTYAGTSTLYQQSAELLYEQLSGYTNVSYTYGTSATPTGHVYMTFKAGQLANDKPGSATPIYVQDPFGNPYGYFNGNAANVPYNGTNEYDLWSTGGDTNNPPVNTATWLTDWGS